jgi:hypothetical protein
MAFHIWFLKSAENVCRCFHVPLAKMHENPVFANKSLKVKSKNKFCRFFYIPKGEAFMYIILKISIVPFF